MPRLLICLLFLSACSQADETTREQPSPPVPTAEAIPPPPPAPPMPAPSGFAKPDGVKPPLQPLEPIVPVDPCAASPADFVCKGYSFSLTEVRGYGDLRPGYGYLDAYPRFPLDVTGVVRKVCAPMEEAKLTRDMSRSVTSGSFDGAATERLARAVSLTGAISEALSGFAARSEPTPTALTYSYVERHEGPYALYIEADPIFKDDAECGESFAYSVGTSASLGVVFSLAFPTAAARDAFVALAGESGARRILYEIGEDIHAVSDVLRESGARVSVDVSAPPGLHAALEPTLRDSRCSVLNLDACRDTFDALYERYHEELKKADSPIWETSRAAFRRYDSRPEPN